MNLTKSQQQKAILSYKEDLQNDDFSVEYDILQPYDPIDYSDSKRKEIYNSISNIDKMSKELEDKIFELNNDIDKLTNHADGLDYTIAVCCGILCGLIDSFVIGEFDFDKALKKSKETISNYVKQKSEKIRSSQTIEQAIENAKKKAYERGKKLSSADIKNLKEKISKGLQKTFKNLEDSDKNNGTARVLQRAIKKLEETYKIPSDNLFNGAGIGVDPTTHHLDDLAHHPTILGLIAAIVGRLFRAGIFINKNGEWSIKFAHIDKEDMLKIWIPIVISGILTWLIYLAKSKYKDEINKHLPKPIQNLVKTLAVTPALVSILEIAQNWLGHLASDMAGSSTSAGKGRDGMGISGLFVSMLKEISSIPPLNQTSLPKIINEIFSKNRFDMRHEMALLNELGHQAIPVILGDVIVRTFYFVRHLIEEYKQHKDFKLVNWHNVIPFNNRTIVRMMTIESGTFTVIDLADAALRAAIKNGTPHNPLFWKDLILRVNFVGIGRFAIAFGTDIGMGIKRQSLIKERLQYKAEKNMLYVAKIYYLQEDMWIETVDTEKAINDMCLITKKSMLYFNESWKEVAKNLEEIQKLDINEIERKNPNLINDLKNNLD